MSEPNVTVIRPELTDEERKSREERVNKCISDLWKAMKRKEKANGKQAQSNGVHV
jgi:sulfur transfer protein SufE